MKKIISYLIVFILTLAVVAPASAAYKYSFLKERKAVPTWVKEYKPYKGIRIPKDPSIRY